MKIRDTKCRESIYQFLEPNDIFTRTRNNSYYSKNRMPISRLGLGRARRLRLTFRSIYPCPLKDEDLNRIRIDISTISEDCTDTLYERAFILKRNSV